MTGLEVNMKKNKQQQQGVINNVKKDKEISTKNAKNNNTKGNSI